MYFEDLQNWSLRLLHNYLPVSEAVSFQFKISLFGIVVCHLVPFSTSYMTGSVYEGVSGLSL